MTGNEIRAIVLEQSHRAHVGHIGSNLCVADILAEIFNVMRPEDRFVLSKGHAALALYAALHLAGKLSAEDLATFCAPGSKLGVHPHPEIPGVEFATGSLGMGLTFANGLALAEKMRDTRANVYVLMSDAELQEGATWEAAMFAAHHDLMNLRVYVDRNHQQALGAMNEILDVDDVWVKWDAFGWEAWAIDGNSAAELEDVRVDANDDIGRPLVIVANTLFGKGVSFMERGEPRHLWHYKPMTDDEYAAAIAEIRA